MNKIAGYLFIYLLFFSGTALSQEYFGQNKVNYTSFSWKYIPTEYFDIYYTEGGYEIALIASRIADDSYKSISAHWNYILKKRIPILVFSSHNDFSQTNVLTDIIEEGTGGFTELFKNRVVIPWEGSLDKFRHVIHHELTHAIMFDMLYGGVMQSLVSREYTFQLPLWFAEGLAEHESQYWSTEADMIMRDGIISGYIPPIENTYGGYLVYKGGESFFRFLQEQYGSPTKWLAGELLQTLSGSKNLERAYKSVLGKSIEDLSKEWQRKLRTDHWPEVAGRELPEDFGVKLTDHEKEKNYLNISPEFNPTGDKIAFLSDRNGYKEILLMRASDGKILETLVKGEKAGDYEEMHWLRGGITWAPDGKMIAFASKSGARDAIHIKKVEDGGFDKEIKLDMGAVYSPSWSPDGSKILFCGIKDGKLDLFTVTVNNGEITRLTDDFFNEADPSWSPDGKRIVFSSDRRDPPYEYTLNDINEDYDLFVMNADGSNIQRISTGPFNDRNPSWSPDGKNLVFTSDRNGINNLYSINLDAMTVMPLTNLLTDASAPVWSPDGNTIAFTCFKYGGWDVYILKRPLKRDIKLENITPTAYRTLSLKQVSSPKQKSDVVLKDSGSGQELAIPKTEEKSYSLKFTPDMINAFASYNTFYGIGGMGQVSFSDIMGNHRINLGAQLQYSLEESNLAISYMYLKKRTNYGFGLFHYKNYYYSSNWDIFSDRIYGGSFMASRPLSRFERLEGAINFLTVQRDAYSNMYYDYYYGPLPGEKQKLAGVRTLGMEANFIHDNALWEYTGPVNGSRYKVDIEYNPSLPQTDLSYTTVEIDYRNYHRFGNKYNIVTRLSGGSSFGRDPRLFFLGGTDNWLNAKINQLPNNIEKSQDTFFSRSPYPLRGYKWNEFYGEHYFLTNFEFRFPFIEYLSLDWPLPLTIGNIGGVIFTDIGSAWGKNERINIGTADNPDYITVYNGSFRGSVVDEAGIFKLNDIKMTWGFGMRVNLGFAILRFDTAWKTDLNQNFPSPMFSVALGPDF